MQNKLRKKNYVHDTYYNDAISAERRNSINSWHALKP